MELYIQLKDGVPFEHPILGENFRTVFPDVDVNNLPNWVARFERIAPPTVDVYEVYEGVTYEWVGSVVTDVHHVRQMTSEEKALKQKEVKDAWGVYPNYGSWVFDEDTCAFRPPVPFPKDGKRYYWDESKIAWVDVVNPQTGEPLE